MAILCNPECARKAQAEIDTVVGQTRLPSFEDEAALPYLKAMIKESMRLVNSFQFSHFQFTIFIFTLVRKRWRPVAPTGIAHAVTQDDYYEGHYIPKGATVYANIL